MLTELRELLEVLLGTGGDPREIQPLQMALRTVVIYLSTLVIVRLGSKRVLGKSTALDVIVGIMIGSVMSRGINGSAALLPTIAGGAVLVALHWVFAILAYHSRLFGKIVKGGPVLLVEDGHLLRREMRRTTVSQNDLGEALRLEGMVPDPSGVRFAYLERNGSISIIPRPTTPRVVDVSVAAGVQTVRIELG